MDSMGSKQWGKAHNAFCSECEAWHFNTWVKHVNGQRTCGRNCPDQNPEAEPISDADIARTMKYLNGLGVDTSLPEIPRERCAWSSRVTSAARAAKLARDVAHNEYLIKEALEEYHWHHAEKEKAKRKA